mmetsp:Transcript_81999/g.235574  ORF Transcript_81999/g.235574 Transcript_81999/m.235574 type:complete len:219 (-) Transcript_81999:61-717(-)|eukprot:CAMPEP_0177231298 /NCGR_PEP_ID=MMETSP0367-20130122/42683_1 /TAXON_ID=447022 ORGANISM="Scrippsiella hangoei-like, Strain SHHI-4" /NCGR_SAMPLE_ID=MMETSP0367 /ASSEMBLY_ACC=CAM_ASM_000362 /LENGTH=218 /DNA_ID=CAMNT_0018681805 /DNA_START=47 /DNA_END=703 /DNA_ORIENTATION=+
MASKEHRHLRGQLQSRGGSFRVTAPFWQEDDEGAASPQAAAQRGLGRSASTPSLSRFPQPPPSRNGVQRPGTGASSVHASVRPSLPCIGLSGTTWNPAAGLQSDAEAAATCGGVTGERWSRSSQGRGASRGASRCGSRCSTSAGGSSAGRPRSSASSMLTSVTTASLRREVEQAVQDEIARAIGPLQQRLESERAARLRAEALLGGLAQRQLLAAVPE